MADFEFSPGQTVVNANGIRATVTHCVVDVKTDEKLYIFDSHSGKTAHTATENKMVFENRYSEPSDKNIQGTDREPDSISIPKDEIPDELL